MAVIGEAAETLHLPAFQRLIPTLQKITNPYHPFDYKTPDDQIFVELKARTFERTRFATTMVGANKVECAKLNPTKTYYFAFSFTDGLYWIKYDPDLFKTFQTKQGGRYDRGRAEVSIYCYIPIEWLEAVESVPPPLR